MIGPLLLSIFTPISLNKLDPFSPIQCEDVTFFSKILTTSKEEVQYEDIIIICYLRTLCFFVFLNCVSTEEQFI